MAIGNISIVEVSRPCSEAISGKVLRSWQHRRKPRPWDQVAQIWFDKTLRNEQAIAMINDGFKPIGDTTIYRKLGKRGTVPGRPSAKRK